MSKPNVDAALQSTRLRKFLHAINEGKRAIKTTTDARLFLEGICSQEDPVNCVERWLASSQALQALKMSLRSDVSSAFINECSAVFLRYIDNDGVRQLCSGQLLQDILVAVIDPPTFWSALVQCYYQKTLSSPSIYGFATLLLELLSSSIRNVPTDIQQTAARVIQPGGLLDSADQETRSVAYKIQDVLRTKASGGVARGTIKPGGRHDNDFEDFRKVAIFPTADEFMAKDQPFYQQSDAVMATPPKKRAAVHLDNQFRLLREDMLAELRDDLKIANGKKKGKRASLQLSGLVFHGIDCGTDERRRPATIAVRCYGGLPGPRDQSEEARKKFYKDNKNVLKHNSFGCLLHNGDIVAFATVHRDEDQLAKSPPIVLLQVFGESAWMKTLLCLKTAHQNSLQFCLVDTPFFAYEPVLRRLQGIASLPLSKELLNLVEGDRLVQSPFKPHHIVQRIEETQGKDLRAILDLPKAVVLDQSQTESFIAGLSQTVSEIQGPPGTGKSFIGALVTKTLHDHTDETILVLCYTNHALDQFLEDIMDIGVSKNKMLRMGAKSTPRTKDLGLMEQAHNTQRSRDGWNILNSSSAQADKDAETVKRRTSNFRHLKFSSADLLEYLLYSDDDFEFYDALSMPESEGDMVQVGQGGRAAGSSYLMERWLKGWDAGIFQQSVGNQYPKVWNMPADARRECFSRWTRAYFEEHAVMLQDIINDYNSSYERLANARDEKLAQVIRNRRIIGCTTTAAAKYAKELINARPGVIIVEEAGEILESHVLAALSINTKHLVLIGDHQQLRPKINNYALTVEKGDGYNLNQSLFERLVLSGYPHTTLGKQHRMRPEISALVRNLTYPELKDAEKTLNRADIRGLQSNVIFFNHNHPEVAAGQIADRRDEGSKASKQNIYEAEMVLKTVRYLAQQGYGTDKQVVLTPYLGQLSVLFNILKTEHDPVLDDLDSFDLVKAGLITPASAKVTKRALRISTIDNYQGEESDIVIASLTRSNEKGEIGFMAAPQRLNVLLSRARDGLIIIGNSSTFTKSRKGKEVWGPFVQQLSQAGQMFDGLPVKCERHPHKVALLKTKADFDTECPDGGCAQPCGAMLKCGKHMCPHKCHQISDHSKMPCEKVEEDVCPQNHKVRWKCYKGRPPCPKCEEEIRKQEARRKRDHELDLKRQATQQAYARQLAELDDEIAHERRLQKEYKETLERATIIRQRKNDLAAAKADTGKLTRADSLEPSTKPSPPVMPQTSLSPNTKDGGSSSPEEPSPSVAQENPPAPTSKAKDEWEHQKQFENADNKHLDTLMDMIGLESVKEQILEIKAKIDTCIRQGASLQKERFGVALLGNPGTGKTTVARLYAEFLASVGVIPGTTIKETTGSRLASDGVQACKKMIEDILNDGGGAIFIDEAYQLASGSSYGGSQVLDFLLAEVENLTGKIVFILAGYNKEMEKFFAHNPGLPSRFPYEFQFHDYEDDELRRIFAYQVNKVWNGRMKIENGLDGLYCRILARRVGYGRGREGFGNARAVENAVSKVKARQATRLKLERRAGKNPDDFLLTQEDLIGPEPSAALAGNKAWQKLHQLTGLQAVKDSVKALLESIQYNYEQELDEQPLVQFNLNRVFLGSPGTGKTTVAKLYGQILADIGLLSSNEVVVKNPSDFTGDVLGASEKTTKGILASTVGKVLVIDEAYGLYGGSASGSGNGGSSDPYKTAVIDTIVAEVQSVPGEDRCVLMLGYKDQMEAMFQNVNPGLSRRFPLSEAFVFEDFTDDELKVILEMKLKQQGYKATDQAKRVAMDVLRRARNRPNFGNAGEVDILLNGAKGRHQQRRSKQKLKEKATLEASDMDPDFNRGERAATNVRKLFESEVGREELVSKLEGYQKMVANMKARDMDPREQIPFNFLFRGPPGTGKTTTAKKMGKIYYDMGFLATAEVVEVSVTNLVGEYIGQTGPKTQKLLEKALGKVLFIDEAYRLADGPFAKEAMDEIVDCLTKPAFAQKLIVILAGYENDINKLMAINPGLTSRFPETISFSSLSPKNCISLFISLLKRKKVNTDVLDSLTPSFEKVLSARFESLAQLDNWANARDIGTLVKAVFGQLVIHADPNSTEPMRVEEKLVLDALDNMIEERRNRANSTTISAMSRSVLPTATQGPRVQNKPPSPKLETGITTAPPKQAEPTKTSPETPEAATGDPRDPGVSDVVWAQLERDKRAAAAREEAYKNVISEQNRLEAEHKQKQEEEEELQLYEEARLEEANNRLAAAEEAEAARVKAEQDEARRRFEQERLRRELERRRREEELAKLEKERRQMEEQRRKEAAVQKKLKVMGLCVMGFRWIKQAGGYRCAGGSHVVSDAQLGLD